MSPERSMRWKASMSDPGFTLNTPRLICSMRWAMPKPCMGWRLRLLSTSMSSVPWMTSVEASGAFVIPSEAPAESRNRDRPEREDRPLGNQDVGLHCTLSSWLSRGRTQGVARDTRHRYGNANDQRRPPTRDPNVLTFLRHTLAILILPTMVTIVIPTWVVRTFAADDSRWPEQLWS